MELHKNGYIFQRDEKRIYKGVDGDNWCLNYCSHNSYYEEYFNKNIDKVWENTDYVDCCIDEEYICCCIEESLRQKIAFRVLLCLTCRKEPRVLNKLKWNTHFLGFDYAYSGGSYYSAVLNDIISERIDEFKNFRLNSNGLFDTYEEVEQFALFRESIKKIHPDYFFEDGDFIIYEIMEVDVEKI